MVKGHDGWQMIKIQVQGDKVLSVETTVGDMRPIAWEAFRIAAAKEFMS